jgi:hypothetical protein
MWFSTSLDKQFTTKGDVTKADYNILQQDFLDLARKVFKSPRGKITVARWNDFIFKGGSKLSVQTLEPMAKASEKQSIEDDFAAEAVAELAAEEARREERERIEMEVRGRIQREIEQQEGRSGFNGSGGSGDSDRDENIDQLFDDSDDDRNNDGREDSALTNDDGEDELPDEDEIETMARR